MVAKKRNFYKKKTGQKKVLRQTIRPTFKIKVPIEDTLELEEDDSAVEESNPSEKAEFDDNTTSAIESKVADRPQKSHQDETVKHHSSDQTQAQINEIHSMIEQASAKLLELQEKKKEQEALEAEANEAEEIEEFNGVDNDEEELELIKEQLSYYQSQNKKLKKELSKIKEDFEKEKKLLEKKIKEVKTDVQQSNVVEDNKFFNFSKDLKEAVQAIESLNDPNFKPTVSQVVIKADEAPTEETASMEKPAEIVVPKKINIEMESEKKKETSDAQSKELEELRSQVQKTIDKKSKKEKKNGKEKKLLMTGVGALVLLFGGGLVSYQFTSKPKVNEKLVNEYLEESTQSQVLGIESQSKVPDGIVADKNSSADYDQTEWAEYESPVFGIRVNYPANVTERLHSSNSITFLRKDSYIFKITKYNTNDEIDEYWESIKDKGVAYKASETKFDNLPALSLEIQEEIDYPGNRYLVKYNGSIYDIWYATDSTKYSADDLLRVEKMLDDFNFI